MSRATELLAYILESIGDDIDWRDVPYGTGQRPPTDAELDTRSRLRASQILAGPSGKSVTGRIERDGVRMQARITKGGMTNWVWELFHEGQEIDKGRERSWEAAVEAVVDAAEIEAAMVHRRALGNLAQRATVLGGAPQRPVQWEAPTEGPSRAELIASFKPRRAKYSFLELMLTEGPKKNVVVMTTDLWNDWYASTDTGIKLMRDGHVNPTFMATPRGMSTVMALKRDEFDILNKALLYKVTLRTHPIESGGETTGVAYKPVALQAYKRGPDGLEEVGGVSGTTGRYFNIPI